MDGQLRLTAEGTGAKPVVLGIDMRHDLLERFRALGPGERMEFEIRAPGALVALVDRIGYLDDLKTFELRHLAEDLQRDLNRVKLKIAKRHDDARCPDCRFVRGHAIACPQIAVNPSAR